jgi:hypothetical protein
LVSNHAIDSRGHAQGGPLDGEILNVGLQLLGESLEALHLRVDASLLVAGVHKRQGRDHQGKAK